MLMRLGLLLAVTLGSAHAAEALVPVPQLKALVTDLTATLNAEQRAGLEARLRALDERKGSQLAVLIVDTTRPEAIEPYALRVAEQWKLGRKKVDDGAILLDVREPHEWAAGHAQGARHIPLGQLGQRQRELPAGRPIITVCRSGGRSARAAALLAEGREVANLRGGMRAWAASDLLVVANGGRPGAVI